MKFWRKGSAAILAGVMTLMAPNAAHAQLRLNPITPNADGAADDAADCDIHIEIVKDGVRTILREVPGSCYLDMRGNRDVFAAYELEYETADGEKLRVPGSYFHENGSGESHRFRIAGFGHWNVPSSKSYGSLSIEETYNLAFTREDHSNSGAVLGANSLLWISN